MASLKQAMKWMKEGKKVFRTSEDYHVYHFKDGKYHCSCGNEVDWTQTPSYAKDFEIKRKITKIIEDCPDCGSILNKNYCGSCNTKWKFSTQLEVKA